MQDVRFFALSDSRQVHNKPFTLRITLAQGLSYSVLIKISEEIIKRPRNVVRLLQELNEPKELRIKPVGKSFLVAVDTKGGKNREPQHYALLKRNGEYRIQIAKAVQQVDLIRHKGEVVSLWSVANGARRPLEEFSMWKPMPLMIEDKTKQDEERLERTPKRQAQCPSWFSESFESTIRKDLFAGEPTPLPAEFPALPSEFPCWSPLFPELLFLPTSRLAEFPPEHPVDSTYPFR